ncbi:conserved hypothetical protein [Paecilomyces variotii No. 5]|uniref:Mid2 domain-containing protein n=1 Tax=Byssochlamys spectabilis (strain No. 5 / NBRC 109023) TaxID=1356009 RepID=V5FYZ4_BYSSN|nr:conserved hypothetical protein [Paecilomyces variotii No. 5]
MDVWYRILLFAYLVRTSCEQTAQSYWTVPDGQLPDFQQTCKDQQVLPIAWNGWDSDWTGEYLEGLTIVDLWVTSFNYDQYPYSQLLHENVDISKAGTYTWTIDINSTALGATAEYVLRFKPPLKTYNVSSGSLSSSGFIVLPATSTAKPTTSARPAKHSIFLTTSSATSLAATPMATGSADSSSLDGGAKAGIAVGCIIGGIAVGFLLILSMRRCRRKKPPSPADGFLMEHNEVPNGTTYTPQQCEDLLEEYKLVLEGTSQAPGRYFREQVAELPSRRY